MIDKIKFMQFAILEAKKAFNLDEVPVGAIIVDKDGKIVSKAHNLIEKTSLATSHAEILAIQKASKKLKSWRLDDLEMYITVEPCAMCAGAIANARIKKVYFGAYEKKSGCAESLYPVLNMSGLNHYVEYEGGLLQDECSALMKNYFKLKRESNKEKQQKH